MKPFRVENFPEIQYQEEIYGNLPLTVNITDKLGATVDLNETMHATPVNTIKQ